MAASKGAGGASARTATPPPPSGGTKKAGSPGDAKDVGRSTEKKPTIAKPSFQAMKLIGAAACLVPLLVLPYQQGSWQYFICHAIAWGAWSALVVKHRQAACEAKWPSALAARGVSGPPGWVEEFPHWAFEGSFYVQLFNVPATLLMLQRVLPVYLAGAIGRTRGELEEDFLRGDMAVQSIILASLFGFMVRDFLMHATRKDFTPGTSEMLLVLHHLFVMGLMGAFYFYPHAPCFQLTCLTTVVVEVGTTSYCSFILWPHLCRGLYIVVMTASNVALLGLILTTISTSAEMNLPIVVMIVIGFILIVGRQGAMFFFIPQYKDIRYGKLAADKVKKKE